MRLQQVLTCMISFIFLLSAAILTAQEMPEGFQELYEEYGILSQELRTTQQLAMQDSELVLQSEEFSTFIDNKLKEKSAEVAELVDKRNELIEGIEKARGENDQESEQELHPLYQSVNQQLQPHLQEIFSDEEVQERQQSLEGMLMEKMSEIDPEVNEKMERLEEISAELQKMMR